MCRPEREIKSSGEAPKNVPSGTGSEKIVQLGSCSRRRRRTAESARGESREAVTRRESTIFWILASGALICATAVRTMAA